MSALGLRVRQRRSGGRPRPEPFTLRDRTLLVREQGLRTGPVFVLVHGIGLSSRSWGRIAPLLAQRGRVVTVELPGFGGAPKPPRAPSVEDDGALLAAFLRQRDDVPAVLVGHSMGAQVVTEAALRVPRLVERLVLIGPVTDPRAPSPLRQAWRLLGLDVFLESPAVNAVMFTDFLRSGLVWYLRTVPSMLRYPMPEALARVRVPGLVIRGAHDPIAPTVWCLRAAGLLRDGRLAEVPGAGHVAMFSHPARVAGEILGDLGSA